MSLGESLRYSTLHQCKKTTSIMCSAGLAIAATIAPMMIRCQIRHRDHGTTIAGRHLSGEEDMQRNWPALPCHWPPCIACYTYAASHNAQDNAPNSFLRLDRPITADPHLPMKGAPHSPASAADPGPSVAMRTLAETQVHEDVT